MEPIPVKTTNLCEVSSFSVQFKGYLSSDFAGCGLYNYCAWLKRYGFWDESSHVVKLGLTVLSSGKLANLYWTVTKKPGMAKESNGIFNLGFKIFEHICNAGLIAIVDVGPLGHDFLQTGMKVTLRLCTLTLLVLPAPPMSLQVGRLLVVSRCVE